VSAHAILKQGPGLPYSFELMSRGLRPLWFRGPLTIPNGHAYKLTIQNVELTKKMSCPSRRRQAVERGEEGGGEVSVWGVVSKGGG